MRSQGAVARSAALLCGFAAAVLLAACGGDDDPANSAPLAVAGNTVRPDGAFCFVASGSSDVDGSVVAWQWGRQPDSAIPAQEEIVDDGKLLCITVARMEPNAADDHIYAYALTVTDDRGASDSAIAEAWVPDTNGEAFPPIPVDAGSDQIAQAGQAVSLTGEISAGEFPCEAASCTWVQMIGPDVGLAVSGSCAAGQQYNASFTSPQVTEGETFLGFRVTAFDDTTTTCETRDYVAVTVRSAP